MPNLSIKAAMAGVCLATALGLASAPASAQQAQPLLPITTTLGSVVVPASSQPSSKGIGIPHTHFEAFVPNSRLDSPQAVGSPDYRFETPASLACVYRRVPRSNRCNPSSTAEVATGGSRLIAIVDAYDHPAIADNLRLYSSTFGLPQANFSVVFASGTRPPQDPDQDPRGNWQTEEALDVEMAHALAPNARIVLVEAASPGDLYTAVDVASDLVAQAGGGEVSMSWGSPEFSGEQYFDSHFHKPGVVYFASTGDNPGTQYPSASAYVVAVGGTSIARDPNTGYFLGEATWSDGGGGPSAYIQAPRFQNNVRYISGPMRATPDVAAVANPNTAVNIYSNIPGSAANTGWLLEGGTSVSAPLVAAITNATGTFRPSSFGELLNLYGNAGGEGFRAVVRGICGPGGGYDPGPTWNACVGLGSPQRPPPF